MIDYEEKIKEFETILEEMFDDFRMDGYVEEAAGVGAALDKFRQFFKKDLEQQHNEKQKEQKSLNISAASEWLRNHVCNYVNSEYNEFHKCVEYDGSIDKERLINDFEEAMQKEQPAEEESSEKCLAECYLSKFDKKFPILPTLKGKQLADYKNFLNTCQQVFGLKEWGIHPTQAKLFAKLTLLWASWGADHLQGIGAIDGDNEMDEEIKPADKIEPKFNVGDKVKLTFEPKYPTREIVEIKDGAYYFDSAVHLPFAKQDDWELVEQKPAEWSDEDEELIDLAVDAVEDFYNGGIRSKIINLLKSLRPSWKPSEEQMKALWKLMKNGVFLSSYPEFQKEIESLYNDLKKRM